MAASKSVTLTAADQAPGPLADVHAYWDELRGEAWAPKWSDFHLYELPPKILPWSIVVDVDSTTMDFRYRFWGTERARLIGQELTGKRVSDIANEYMRDANMAQYVETLELKVPMLFETPVVKESEIPIVVTSIRLPLSEDGESISNIFSAVNHEELSAGHYAGFGTEIPSGGL
jgi:hypothetical protein